MRRKKRTNNESGTMFTLLNIRYFCLREREQRFMYLQHFLSSITSFVLSFIRVPFFFAIQKSMVIARLLEILIPFVWIYIHIHITHTHIHTNIYVCMCFFRFCELKTNKKQRKWNTSLFIPLSIQFNSSNNCRKMFVLYTHTHTTV